MKKDMISILKIIVFIKKDKVIVQGREENELFLVNGHQHDNTAMATTFSTTKSKSIIPRDTLNMGIRASIRAMVLCS
jgi:hypothetical protein